MALNRIDGDLNIQGTLTARFFNPPASSITDAAVEADAGIDASKLQHQHRLTYAQAGGAASVAERKIVHQVRGATATLNEVRAGTRTLCTVDAAITVDLYKNGSSILTAPIVLNSGNVAYVAEDGTIASAALVEDDVLEVYVTVAAGAGALGNGVFVHLNLDEDYD